MNKKSFLSLFFIFCLLAFSSHSYAEVNLAANFYLEKGKKNFAIKEYDLAITDFHKALLADPNNEEALMYLRMLGFGGEAKDDQIARREQGESFKQETKSTKQEVKATKTKEIADNKKPTKDQILPKEAKPKDLTIKEIETQTAKEEKAALQALRVEAAEKEKIALEEIRSQKNNEQKERTAKDKTHKASTAQKASKTAPTQVPEEISSVESKESKSKGSKQAQSKSQLKAVGKSEKIVGDDIDDDGQQQESPSIEKETIEKSQAKTAQKEKADVKTSKKKAKKKAAKKEKVSAKKCCTKAGKADKKELSKKIGDSAASDPAVGKVDLSSENKACAISGGGDASGVNDGEISVDDELLEQVEAADMQKAAMIGLPEQEAKVKAEIQEELAQKEKAVQQKFAQKKAERIRQAQKASSAKVADRSTGENFSADGEQPMTADLEDVGSLLAADPAVEQAVMAAKNENVILKKKLAAVVEMSQQDQQIIQDLEKNTKQQNKKVAVLENDLVETTQALELKKVANKEQEEKLKGLQARVSALELDIHSKQYDFKDKQLEYEKKVQVIEEELGNYKSQKANSEAEFKEQLRILKEALAKKIAELNDAQDKLIFVENKLKMSEAQRLETVKQYDDVKKTLGDLESRLANLQIKMKTDDAPLITVDPKNLPLPKNQDEFLYQQWIQRHDKLVTKLKAKLLWAREQMDYLGRYDIMISDQKMAALKEQLAAVKKQLSGSAVSSQKPEDYVAMEERLKDAQQRLEMVEKILREKEEQNRELEKQLNGVLSAF